MACFEVTVAELVKAVDDEVTAHQSGMEDMMRARDMILRCYGEHDGDLWVAVCVDLSLAAQAESLKRREPSSTHKSKSTFMTH